MADRGESVGAGDVLTAPSIEVNVAASADVEVWRAESFLCVEVASAEEATESRLAIAVASALASTNPTSQAVILATLERSHSRWATGKPTLHTLSSEAALEVEGGSLGAAIALVEAHAAPAQRRQGSVHAPVKRARIPVARHSSAGEIPLFLTHFLACLKTVGSRSRKTLPMLADAGVDEDVGACPLPLTATTDRRAGAEDAAVAGGEVLSGRIIRHCMEGSAGEVGHGPWCQKASRSRARIAHEQSTSSRYLPTLVTRIWLHCSRPSSSRHMRRCRRRSCWE